MRPGQAAPVFATDGGGEFASQSPFNEAGAGCPGIRSCKANQFRPRPTFNEAGAGCPGIPRGGHRVDSGEMRPSMRPGQAAPVFKARAGCRPNRRSPSMRPGQAAPVFGAIYTSLSQVANLR